LRAKFESGLVATDASHEFGQALKLLFDEIASGRVFTSENPLTIALHRLLEERRGLNLQIDILEQVHDVVAAAIKIDPEQFPDALKKAFPDPMIGWYAVVEASSLIRRTRTICHVRKMLENFAPALLICRGMFYRTILEGQGTTLERTAVRRAIKEKGADAFDQFLGLIPVIGDSIGMIKLVISTIADLTMKEQILEREAGSLAEKYELVDDYITTYNMAMKLWLDWASEVAGGVTDMMKSSFLPRPTG
jgi:hypothetical protein